MERTIKKIVFPVQETPKLTRVAAYARVSSGKDAMLHSLSAQVSYYNDLIQRYPGWVFCGVYADEALTGAKADRENFTRLLQDCKAGKVDMVITKSISRFARNTVTLLENVRKLKQIGVDVYFEEQNIHSISADGELMERYERHTSRYEKMKKQYEAIEAERQRRKEQNDRISAFSAMLAGQSEMPIEFNDDLWLAAVDHATVNADETGTFTFKSGIEITEQM